MAGKQVQFSDVFHKTYDPSVRAAHALSGILTQTDRILLGRRDLTVTIVNSADEDIQPLRTIYEKGTHNINSTTYRHREHIVLPSMTCGISKDPVVTTLGYNYHAIGHRFFTPRDRALSSKVSTWMNLSGADRRIAASGNANYFHNLDGYAPILYHMFECARIERLMIAAYPSTRSYFAAATYNKISTILDSSSDLGRAGRIFGSYLYLALRPYLARPLRLRALADLKTLIPSITFEDNDVADVLHKYLSLSTDTLDLPASVSRASGVFYDLMNTVYDSANIGVRAPGESIAYGNFMLYLANARMLCTCADNANNSDGEPPNQDHSQEALQAVAGDQDQADGDGAESDVDGSSGQSDADADSEPGQGASSGSQDGSLEDALESASEAARNEAHDNDASRGEVEQLRGAMAGRGTFSSTHTATKRNTSSEYVLMQRQMSREFGKVVEEADPGFVTHQPSGRVSMRRAMTGVEDYDTAFDSWDEGNTTATSMEVVLLVDRSGSMSSLMTEACQSAWAIARGVESLGDNVRVTTLFFDDESVLVKASSDREDNRYRSLSSSGGTDPTTALVDALNIFRNSGRAHRICIILTDGQWYGTGRDETISGESVHLFDSDQVVTQIRNDGGYVGIATMMSDEYYQMYVQSGRDQFRHNANYENRIESPKDFVSFARGIVKEIMTNG